MDTQFIGEHGIRLDLVATTSTGEILNVVLRKQVETYYVTFSSLEGSKMQKHCDSSRIKNNDALREQLETNMYKRSLFYWAKIYYSQLKKGQKYKELCPVIAINILDFNLFKANRCNKSFILKDTETNEEYLRMIVLQSS